MSTYTEDAAKKAVALVQAIEPDYSAARQDARSASGKVASLAFKYAVYNLLRRFRGVREGFELWPVAVMVAAPFAAGALVFVLADYLGVGNVAFVFWLLFGPICTALACAALLWYPSSEEIARRIPQLDDDMVQAKKTSRIADEQLQAVKARYDAARTTLRKIQAELARIEQERQEREAERRRQEELARQRWLNSQEYRRQQLFRRNWKAMRGVEFEGFLREVFEALGYGVETTKVTGDQGVDLIVQHGDRRIAVQVKGYVHSVGNEAVQQAHTGMVHYRCQACAVITNSRFSRAAQELAQSVRCTLIDEDCMEAFVMGTLRL